MGQKGSFTVRTIVTAMMLAAAMLTAGCNTVQGVGKDVASVGDTVAKAAK
jgi:predicted small secreted protein